jgi:hypothetical protein
LVNDKAIRVHENSIVCIDRYCGPGGLRADAMLEQADDCEQNSPIAQGSTDVEVLLSDNLY